MLTSQYVLFGNKSRVHEISETIKKNPLIFKGNTLKERQFEHYLGDYVGESAEASAEKTVNLTYIYLEDVCLFV